MEDHRWLNIDDSYQHHCLVFLSFVFFGSYRFATNDVSEVIYSLLCYIIAYHFYRSATFVGCTENKFSIVQLICRLWYRDSNLNFSSLVYYTATGACFGLVGPYHVVVNVYYE